MFLCVMKKVIFKYQAKKYSISYAIVQSYIFISEVENLFRENNAHCAVIPHSDQKNNGFCTWIALQTNWLSI